MDHAIHRPYGRGVNERAVAVFLLALVVGLGVVAIVFLARRGPIDLDRAWVAVRCREGHVFSTIWIPGISLKSIRLGPLRLQWCPVGEHRTFVTPVPWSALDDHERLMATRYRDSRVP